jgi:hypothetical protein
MNTYLNKFVMSTIVSGLFLVAHSASAQTAAPQYGVQMHGFSCFPYGTFGATYGASSIDGISNTSTTASMTAICPLIIPSTPGGVAYNNAQLLIDGWSNNSGQLTKCTLFVTGSYGAYEGLWSDWSVSIPYNSGYPDSNQTLIEVVPADEQNFLIECVIPPATGLGASYLTNLYLTLDVDE